MVKPEVIYLLISGAGVVRETPELIQALTRLDLPLYTMLTENAERVISPRQLVDLPGHQFIDSYFDPLMFHTRKPGLLLVAPATFNTVNKISQGIADTLAHSLTAEAIGADWPVVIAPSSSTPLANHPRFKWSLQTLEQWGIRIVPQQKTDSGGIRLASVADIVQAVQATLKEITE